MRLTCNAAVAVSLLLLGPAAAASEEKLRCDTLEDIYGEAGDRFQAAVGILIFEKPALTDPDPVAGFGIAVDDMVLEWREFYLDDDNATCGSGGECAVISLQSANFFESSALLEITLLEKSPSAVNDCDLDGDTDGPGDAADCDSDGTNDLPVKVTSEAEIEGEIVYADHVGGYLYRAELPLSSLYDSPGVLFVQPYGLDNPTVCAVYQDGDDGSGQPCLNSPDPAIQGRLQSCTSLYLSAGNIVLLNTILYDNRDDDGWADSNETVDMAIVVSNKSGVDISRLTAKLLTNDPKIDCIVNASINIGELEAGAIEESGELFTFKMADIDRSGEGLSPTDNYSAALSVMFSADQFDTVYSPQSFTLDLDLDAGGGSGPGTYLETFENGNFGSFTTMNLDYGFPANPWGSDGMRCQYSDPDWWYSNGYPETGDCWLGATPTQADAYFWQIDSSVAGENARAYDDAHSAYMGVYDAANSWWTTPTSNLEAFGTNEPVNLGWAKICEETRTVPCDSDDDCVPPACPTCNPLGESCVGAAPELSFKHQISLMDWRHSNAAPGTSGDCGVVMVQLADTDSSGTPTGDWIKIYPNYNVYDQQRYDGWTNCQFDPTDDGNDEDDFFDPFDPYRRLGPSSTCFPEFSFSNVGETFLPYRGEIHIQNASEPNSGLEGWTGIGTWVESRFDLQRFRGRRLRLRFLNTALKLSPPAETWEDAAAWNPGPWDDGWWIDDIRVRDTLASHATIINDDKDNSALPGCGDICNSVTADLAAAPPGTLAAPGQVVELSALGSYANRCVGGTLQFRFWIDDGLSQDTLLRGWTDNPVIVQAPLGAATYVVDVRCSTATTCSASTSIEVPVNCPQSGAVELFGDIYAFPGHCQTNVEEFCASDSDCLLSCVIPEHGDPEYGTIYLSWESGKGPPRRISTVRLDDGNRANGYYVDQFWYDIDMKGLSDNAPLGPARWWWYLMRTEGEYCNERGTWQTSEGAEPARDEELP